MVLMTCILNINGSFGKAEMVHSKDQIQKILSIKNLLHYTTLTNYKTLQL